LAVSDCPAVASMVLGANVSGASPTVTATLSGPALQPVTVAS